MALTTVMPAAAKLAYLRGEHAAGDTYKMALVKVAHAGTYDKTFVGVGTPGTGAPSTTNLGTDEASGTGYTSGGFTMTGYATSTDTTASNNAAWIDWTTDPNWTTSTISAVGAIIYNDTDAGKPACGLYDFGTTVSSTAGTFTVTLPAAAAATAVLRIT